MRQEKVTNKLCVAVLSTMGLGFDFSEQMNKDRCVEYVHSNRYDRDEEADE